MTNMIILCHASRMSSQFRNRHRHSAQNTLNPTIRFAATSQHVSLCTRAPGGHLCSETPVTTADLSAQALINTMLGSAFPSDPIVGEEDASDLRGTGEAQRLMQERITDLANDALTRPLNSDERKEWGLGNGKSTDELLDAIDRGSHAGGKKGR